MAGIAQGIQPLVSYYYGRKMSDKYHKLLKYALAFGSVFSITAFIVSRMIAAPLVGLFISPGLKELRRASVSVFCTFSYSFLLCGFNVIIGGFFTAIEYPKSAMAISLGRGFFFVALSLRLLTALFGGEGIWWAAALAEGICLALTSVLFLRYKNRHGQI